MTAPSPGQDRRVLCRSYTQGRRHPLVLGKIGDTTLPFTLSPAQVLTLVGGLAGLLATRGVWGPLVPGVPDLVVIAALPAAGAWAVRYLRIEGRSPLAMAAGLLTLWSQPRAGRVRGRPARWGRRHRSAPAGPYISSAGPPTVAAGPGWSRLKTGRGG